MNQSEAVRFLWAAHNTLTNDINKLESAIEYFDEDKDEWVLGTDALWDKVKELEARVKQLERQEKYNLLYIWKSKIMD